MILACPFCHTRYLISANVFALGPRQVRCARCSHKWQADLPKEIDAVVPPPEIDLTPEPEAVAPIPPGSNLPVLRKQPMSRKTRRALKIGAGVVIIILLAGLVLFRQDIAANWPAVEDYYDDIGLRIYHYGDGLRLEKVRSELRYDSGIMELTVEGKIRNGTANVQEIPNIMAVAIGADGSVIQSWQIDAPALRVFPGEAMPFHSVINAPKGTVEEINLSFIEIKHDND